MKIAGVDENNIPMQKKGIEKEEWPCKEKIKDDLKEARDQIDLKS